MKREDEIARVTLTGSVVNLLLVGMKAVRLPGTEHMDKAYHQKRYHFVQSLWGMLIGLIPCLAGAGLYACFLG